MSRVTSGGVRSSVRRSSAFCCHVSRFSTVKAEIVFSASLLFLFGKRASFLGGKSVNSLDGSDRVAVLVLDLSDPWVSCKSWFVSQWFGEGSPVVVEVSAFLYQFFECVRLWNELR